MEGMLQNPAGQLALRRPGIWFMNVASPGCLQIIAAITVKVKTVVPAEEHRRCDGNLLRHHGRGDPDSQTGVTPALNDRQDAKTVFQRSVPPRAVASSVHRP